ncbi:MAG: glycosyltransferase family 2 protein [Rickettsiales bacterium]|nr:glycosyltransferase family 2 protein [Rickettsiales bacterium]
MNQRLPISVFIIALNEADRIHVPIASVKDWVDEIIVVDSGSTDDTVSIAASQGAKTYHNPWPGYGLQKRFGEDQCKNRWLLNIDADEEITPALAAEIQALFANGEPPEAGFTLRIRDLLPGEQKLSRFAHTNFVLRLYNREKGRFSDSPVHDSVLTSGPTRTLTQPVLHRSFRSLAHMLEKMNAYSSLQAQNLLKKGMTLPYARMLIEIPFAFFKDYILRGYIFRGRRGFINAVMYSFGRFIRIAKYLELKDKGEA